MWQKRTLVILKIILGKMIAQSSEDKGKIFINKEEREEEVEAHHLVHPHPLVHLLQA